MKTFVMNPFTGNLEIPMARRPFETDEELRARYEARVKFTYVRELLIKLGVVKRLIKTGPFTRVNIPGIY